MRLTQKKAASSNGSTGSCSNGSSETQNSSVKKPAGCGCGSANEKEMDINLNKNQ